MLNFEEKVDWLKAVDDSTLGTVLVEATYFLLASNGEFCFRRVVFDKPSSVFTTFEELSEQQVLEWVKTSLGEDEINAMKNGIISKSAEDKPIESFVNPPWQNKE